MNAILVSSECTLRARMSEVRVVADVQVVADRALADRRIRDVRAQEVVFADFCFEVVTTPKVQQDSEGRARRLAMDAVAPIPDTVAQTRVDAHTLAHGKADVPGDLAQREIRRRAVAQVEDVHVARAEQPRADEARRVIDLPAR